MSHFDSGITNKKEGHRTTWVSKVKHGKLLPYQWTLQKMRKQVSTGSLEWAILQGLCYTLDSLVISVESTKWTTKTSLLALRLEKQSESCPIAAQIVNGGTFCPPLRSLKEILSSRKGKFSSQQKNLLKSRPYIREPAFIEGPES